LRRKLASLRTRIAIHESGHCVAALATGLGVHHASIGYDDGEVKTIQRPNVIFYLSGFAAELRFDPASVKAVNSLIDFDNAARLLAAEENINLSHCFDQANQIIDQYWAELSAIAAVLERRGSVEGIEIPLILAVAR